jgi:hypothetical protein
MYYNPDWFIFSIHMYVNGKMMPTETTPGVGAGEDKGE